MLLFFSIGVYFLGDSIAQESYSRVMTERATASMIIKDIENKLYRHGFDGERELQPHRPLINRLIAAPEKPLKGLGVVLYTTEYTNPDRVYEYKLTYEDFNNITKVDNPGMEEADRFMSALPPLSGKKFMVIYRLKPNTQYWLYGLSLLPEEIRVDHLASQRVKDFDLCG